MLFIDLTMIKSWIRYLTRIDEESNQNTSRYYYDTNNSFEILNELNLICQLIKLFTLLLS